MTTSLRKGQPFFPALGCAARLRKGQPFFPALPPDVRQGFALPLFE